MSDAELLKVIEEMEAHLRTRCFSMDSRAVQDWQRKFQAAVASAERGQDWPAIVQKAQLVQSTLEQTLAEVVAGRDAFKREVEGWAKGNRVFGTYRHGRS